MMLPVSSEVDDWTLRGEGSIKTSYGMYRNLQRREEEEKEEGGSTKEVTPIRYQTSVPSPALGTRE